MVAAFCYAVGALYAQHHIEAVPVLVFSTAQCVAGALVLLPFGVAQLPSEAPGWKAIASVLALGIAGTAVGTLLYYRLVNLHGSARASLVVYLLPPFALVYGATLLDESLTPRSWSGSSSSSGASLSAPGSSRGRAGRRRCPNERPHPPRDRGRRRLPARAREPRGRRAVHVRVRPRDRETLLEEIERSEREPLETGRFVIEVGDGGEWKRAGVHGIRRREPAQQDRESRRPRDASGFPRTPALPTRPRGSSNGTCCTTSASTAFSSSATASTSAPFGTRSASGFVREGVKRKAYLRHGEWVDGIMFGLLKEDLDARESDALVAGVAKAISDINPA